MIPRSTKIYDLMWVTVCSGGLARRETGIFPGGPCFKKFFGPPAIHANLFHW